MSRRGRGGRGSDKAADCRESGHVWQPAPNKGNTPKCAAFSQRELQKHVLSSHLAMIPSVCVCGVLGVFRCRFEAERGSRLTNTGLGGVTPCTQPCLPRLLLQRPLPFTFLSFLSYFHQLLPHTLFPLVVWFRFVRLRRGSVTALFPLFEKAMLSASQDDITLRASYWWSGAERPYLKEQCTDDDGGGGDDDEAGAA